MPVCVGGQAEGCLIFCTIGRIISGLTSRTGKFSLCDDSPALPVNTFKLLSPLPIAHVIKHQGFPSFSLILVDI